MGLRHSPKIVTDGLVLCLDAANAKSYPGSGTTWYDLSNNGNDSALTNGPTFSGDDKGVIVFDGVNDYVLKSSFPFSFTSESFSINFWLNVTNQIPNYGICICGAGPFNLGGMGLEIRIQTALLECTINDGVSSGIRTQLSSACSTNEWNNFYFTFDRNSLSAKIYKNSILRTTRSYSGETSSVSTYDLRIGRGNDRYLNGKISNFSIYNRALSDSEVRQNYQALRGRYGI